MRAIQIILFITLPFTFLNLSRAQDPDGSRRTIHGTVYAARGETPIEGAQVEIIPSGGQVFTTEGGSYELDLPGDEVWVKVSYPGYSSREILVHPGDERDIFLQSLSERSGDRALPGPFGNLYKYKNSPYRYLSGDELSKTPETNLEMAVQGRLAGLTVKRLSGMPWEGGILDIRGISSLFASHQPVILLDGVPLENPVLSSTVVDGTFSNMLSAVDVNDVDFVQVYPDGASLYGMQGGQGLIMITTKQPASVSTKVDFSLYSGLSFKPDYLPLLSADEHKTYLLNLLESSDLSLSEINQQNPWISGNPSYYYYYNYDNNTNWQDEVFSPALVNKLNATLQGGDEIARFSVSLGYLNQSGVVKNTGYQRYNFRFNADVRIVERLYMLANVGFAYHLADLKYFGTDYTLNPVTAALLKPPMLAPYLRDNLGNRIALLSDADLYGFSNPAALVDKTESSSFGSNLFVNGQLRYELTPGLNLSTLVNVTYNNIKENAFLPDYGIADRSAGFIKNLAKEGITKISGILSESRLEYTGNLNFRHFIHAAGGMRISTYQQNFSEGTVYNTPTDEFKSLSSVTSVEDTYLGGSDKVVHRSDLFLNGSYRFKDRYLADLVLTLSGSSNVGPEADALNLFGGKWGLFPSLHLGWLISSEPFLRNNNAVDLLKLRASLGISGNDFYSKYSRYTYSSRVYGTNSGMVRNFIPNPALKWEQLRQVDAGIDAALLHERLQLSADIYRRNTLDLLTYRKIPVTAGFDYYWENNGSLSSEGIEMEALGKILDGRFRLSLGANLGINRSSLSLPEDLVIDIPGGQVIAADGETPFAFYGLLTEGVFPSTADAQAAALVNGKGMEYRAGDIHFTDRQNDHVIDELDRVSLGDLFPKLTGGVHSELSVWNFSLFVLFDFAYGNKVFNYPRMLTESFSGYGNQTTASLYTWKGDGDATGIPAIRYGDPVGNASFSDRWIEDGSFFRLRQITFAYAFPKAPFYKNLTLYITGENLFTSTRYLGYSPEFAGSVNPALQGSDYGQVPLTPMAVLGIKIGF